MNTATDNQKMNTANADSQKPKRTFASNESTAGSSEKSGTVTSMRTQASSSQQKDAGTEEKASEDKTPSAKSAGFSQQLDLALVDASISIGDIVKKIDALAPKEGAIAKVSQFAVGKLGNVQNYLGDNSSKDILSGAWQLLRKSPWPVGLALVGAGIGYYIQKSSSKSEGAAKQNGASKSESSSRPTAAKTFSSKPATASGGQSSH